MRAVSIRLTALLQRSAISLAITCASMACVSQDPPYSFPASAALTPTGAPLPLPPTVDEGGSEARQVFDLTNTFRVSNGLPPLNWSAPLAAAAQAYAARMANEGFFSHTAPDGSTMDQRITTAGYSWSSCGENIAYGSATPDAVMQAWMNSSGHRANLLGASYQDLGVGLALGPDGTPYWVQDFGAP